MADETGDVLTIEKLNEAIASLRKLEDRPLGPFKSSLGLGFAAGPRFFVSDYLPAEAPRKLTRWERFRVWVEDLADRADIDYHYPRVKRAEPVAAYLFGRDLYIPRPAAAVLMEVS